MTVNPFRPILAAVAAVLVAAGVAHADTPDAQFLGLLSNDGLNVGAPDRLIAIAHERCDDQGLSRDAQWNWIWGAHQSPYAQAMWQITHELQAQGLTDAQVPQFVRNAMTVYCPTPPDQ
ncbi:MAG TPA: DUF732 domain-containing protein [Mycobacterium sp.]|jgi:hypothetical protein|nr:DUF732 domain-containing protein [Mycobacterium sp.]